ncbi:AAA family ATPase, partial [Roseomonas sp. BN140053]|uniref:AAA family ATPase n=1 Tax=Roseomonas sp. BN140053 TaxID=3391898 RepID=UPI0039E7CB94
TRMFIGGPTGLGKTHLGFALAAGMASGRGFLHWKAARRCRVLYIDGEMSRDLVQERLRDLARRMTGADLSGLFVLCAEDCEDLAKRFPQLGFLEPLNTDGGQAFILKLIEMLGGVDAVFFDNRMSLLCGDMKEEEPWTKTMPLVKELTRKRIAQIWLDHTGHNTGQLYGTKTKEWQFDAVGLLTKLERTAADIAFTLEWTKARRRKPSNRADFETVTLTMTDDAWAAEGADPSASGAARRVTLTPAEHGWHGDIVARFAMSEGPDGPQRMSVPGSSPDAPGASVLTLTHDQLRAWLLKKGRIETDTDGKLTPASRQKRYKMFNELKDKGKLCQHGNLYWLPNSVSTDTN